MQHVRLVLQQLLRNHLFIKLEKSEFHVQEVSFLGFKNQKPDALSRQFDPPNMVSTPVSIIPPSKILAPVRWGIETIVRNAQQQEPDPGNGPPGRFFCT